MTDKVEGENFREEQMSPKDIIENIYLLRDNFLIIGLTGRTGSGCTTVARMLGNSDVKALKSDHRYFRSGVIDNKARKDRIVRDFIEKNWTAFTIITVSDIIYLIAFTLSFDQFISAIVDGTTSAKVEGTQDEIRIMLEHKLNNDYKKEYEANRPRFESLLAYLDQEDYKKGDEAEYKRWYDLIFDTLPKFRQKTEELISLGNKSIISQYMQTWGDNIRTFKTVSKSENKYKDAPEELARLVSHIVKLIQYINKKEGKPTHIVIDALRNPFEILYFRERWSAFYCMSVNTIKEVRHDKLLKEKKLNAVEIEKIDEREAEKKDVRDSFRKIDIDRCLQLTDIHLSHDGTPENRNFNLVNQLLTYVSLMLHPGLVPPTPQERLMQIAFTAKLNSGCLSRQVGAAITDSNYSLRAIGWNSSPAGTVPCTLRRFEDLVNHEDSEAFSVHEREDGKFRKGIEILNNKYTAKCREDLNGLSLSVCFKDVHTRITSGQLNNQVHTRSLHAEENAFLQLAKYGGNGIEGGKLFTTASCCELCAKKAYHLGIREIYYIDSYPGISLNHIFNAGNPSSRPRIILFSGAVGKAFINLYNPFVALKDEIEARTSINVKGTLKKTDEQLTTDKTKEQNGSDSQS